MADDDELWFVLRRIDLETRFQQFSNGPKSSIGTGSEGGLSVGEVQRFAFTRALLRESAVIVLHEELFSALDMDQVGRLCESLQGLTTCRALFVVGYREVVWDVANSLFTLRSGALHQINRD